MAAAAAAEAVEAAVEATVVAMGVAVRRPEAVYIRIKSIVKASISLSSTRKGYGSGVWIKGMDQSMDRGVWIVCSFGALIHTLYFDSYPYSFLVGSGSDVCVNSPSLPGVGGRGRSPLIIFVYNIDIHVWYGKSKASADWEVLLKILTQPPSKSAGTETGMENRKCL